MSRASDLRRLADRIGIIPKYRDMAGNEQRPSVEVQEALAAALGFPCDGATGPGDRLAEIDAVDEEQLLEPVAVIWTDTSPTLVATQLRTPLGCDDRVEWQMRKFPKLFPKKAPYRDPESVDLAARIDPDPTPAPSALGISPARGRGMD